MKILLGILSLMPCAATMATSSSSPLILRSACACGKVLLSIQYPSSPAASTTTILTDRSPAADAECLDCHCPSCRSYHDSAFVSYLKLSQSLVTVHDNSNIQTYTESASCRQFGPTERVSCRHCSSKLFTRLKPSVTIDDKSHGKFPSAGSSSSSSSSGNDQLILVNLGCLVDESIPKHLSKAWRNNRMQYQEASKAPWLHAKPGTIKAQQEETSSSQAQATSRYLTGSCACERHAYRIRLDDDKDSSSSSATQEASYSLELQHCYCKLCRQLSGGPFMTWMPVEDDKLEWFIKSSSSGEQGSSAEPPLIRTTSHGQRHICQTCRSVMTIVYDEQPEVVWPVAASLHDDVSTVEGARNREILLHHQCHYDRVLHICCRYKQPWYQLPKDGLERVQEAC